MLKIVNSYQSSDVKRTNSLCIAIMVFTFTYSTASYTSDLTGLAQSTNDSVNKPHFKSKHKRKSDPLGQQARLPDSIPETENSLVQLPKDIAALKAIIEKIQLTLYLEDLYSGDINGKLDSKTKRSIIEYKKLSGFLPGDELLDSQTLVSLGMVGK